MNKLPPRNINFTDDSKKNELKKSKKDKLNAKNLNKIDKKDKKISEENIEY